MFSRLRSNRISPASALALVALFVSLGGVSYAAATIGSAEIKDNSIRSKDVRNKTLVGKDVKANALGGNQVDEGKLGKVPSAATADSAQEAANAQSAVTAQTAVNAQTAAAVGPDGAGSDALQASSVRASELGATVVRTGSAVVAAGGTEFVSAACQAGEQMLSGGGSWLGAGIEGDAAGLRVVHSYPNGNGWSIRAYNATATPREFQARVACLDG
jgi:hypothetical protein